ncbi:MAG: nucleotidyltransferase family protein [Halopseudomonas aestusnigri]
MLHWPETVTAIAVKLNSDNELEVLAPFGLEDLYNKTVQPSPHFKNHKLFEFKIRQDKKRWGDRWSNLDFRA